MVEMMDCLGYHRFGCLGGDWGATTSNYMALDFPDRLCGLYLTMVATGPPLKLRPSKGELRDLLAECCTL